MLVLELGVSAIPSIVRDKVKEQNNDRQASHDLQSFSFESISVATSNFSTENKLGEGGFGPVYKVLSLSLSLCVCMCEIKFENIIIIIKCKGH